ncbi:MAG: LON peptidase substrate-binding domain-containing protein [Acidimicrobiia bacterium]|nr:LON peptidase substrate-binding domain-containing protein [Acidimicrobiia bacterium]NNK91120.1 LON peptidase substrate-binding domain-containing protein [Acidimicrobiia bacterium]
METLPLFPLGRVLLPGQPMVLQVFEPRYHALLADIGLPPGVETGPSDLPARFGVVFIRDGLEVGGEATHHDVGTVVRVEGTREVGDGRRMVVVLGERLFRITDLLPDDPYPRAVVTVSEEIDDAFVGDVDVDDLARALRRYLAVLAESGRPADITVEISSNAAMASYQVASLLRLSSPEVQELMETTSVYERVQREVRLLELETRLLERTMGAG